MSSPDPGNGRGGGGSQGACAESWFPGRRLWSGKSRLAPGVRRRTQRSPSCRRAGSRAGLGAGPGARLNEEGRFACHSGLAAVPLLPSPLSCEGHAAQHRVRGRGVGREVAGATRRAQGGSAKLRRALELRCAEEIESLAQRVHRNPKLCPYRRAQSCEL